MKRFTSGYRNNVISRVIELQEPKDLVSLLLSKFFYLLEHAMKGFLLFCFGPLGWI